MKLATVLFAGALSLAALAQDLRPVKIQIHRADPWAIKALLEGQSLMSPELSTVLRLFGAPAGMGPAMGTGTPWFPEGSLMVNPADNSLWFVPQRVPATGGG
ncbi:MAG TPA: hypothetical protein VM328_01275 [Fimbriimonadaceae bacterium]|nr:hypothetical protein [Fimbriimonadaceae bacterium]